VRELDVVPLERPDVGPHLPGLLGRREHPLGVLGVVVRRIEDRNLLVVVLHGDDEQHEAVRQCPEYFVGIERDATLDEFLDRREFVVGHEHVETEPLVVLVGGRGRHVAGVKLDGLPALGLVLGGGRLHVRDHLVPVLRGSKVRAGDSGSLLERRRGIRLGERVGVVVGHGSKPGFTG